MTTKPVSTSTSASEHIVQLFGPDIRGIARPLVEWMQVQLQRLYPEQDFTFTEDEWVRDIPGEYELRIDWYRWAYRDNNLPTDFIFNRFELLRPGKIVRDILNFGDSNLQFLPGTVQTPLRDFFLAFQQKLREEADWDNQFELNTTYHLRLRW